MGGRGATSGILTFGRKAGTRLTPIQMKNAVSEEAEKIFDEISRTPAMQNIIRKSFRGSTTEITLEVTSGGKTSKEEIVDEIDRYTKTFEQRIEKEQRIKKDTAQWSEYDVSRAKMQALKQALTELRKVKKFYL